MPNTLLICIAIFFLISSVITASNYPSVPLKYTSSGYTVTIALRSNATNTTLNASNIQTEDQVDLLLGLYTSRTLLAGDCVGFTDAADSHDWDYNVLNQEIPDNSDFPYFLVNNGTIVENQCYLSSNYYSATFQSLIPSTCFPYGNASYGSGANGILGMALTVPGWQYYQGTPIISVYLDGYGMDGQLIFGSDLENYANSTTPTASFYTDFNWRSISKITSIQVGTTSYNTTSGSVDLLFDINANAIGFPQDIFNNIISGLDSFPGLSCQTAVPTTPTCNYTGAISSLPSISIVINLQSIILPGEVYAQTGPTTGTITFEFEFTQ